MAASTTQILERRNERLAREAALSAQKAEQAEQDRKRSMQEGMAKVAGNANRPTPLNSMPSTKPGHISENQWWMKVLEQMGVTHIRSFDQLAAVTRIDRMALLELLEVIRDRQSDRSDEVYDDFNSHFACSDRGPLPDNSWRLDFDPSDLSSLAPLLTPITNAWRHGYLNFGPSSYKLNRGGCYARD